jgi:hypothetical protein
MEWGKYPQHQQNGRLEGGGEPMTQSIEASDADTKVTRFDTALRAAERIIEEGLEREAAEDYALIERARRRHEREQQ